MATDQHIGRLLYRVVGVTPLMMHNPLGSMQGATTRKEVPLPEVEAERGAYRAADGQLYVKSEALLGSIRNAAAGFRAVGRYGKTSAKKAVAGSLMPRSEQCPLYSPGDGLPLREYVVDVRRAVIQGQGILRARPRLDEWACDVEFEYDKRVFGSVDLITQIFEQAGATQGVGDQRPGAPKTPGRFGKYSVTLLAQE